MTITASHLHIRVLLSLLAEYEQTSSLWCIVFSVTPTELQGFSSDGNNHGNRGLTPRTLPGSGCRAPASSLSVVSVDQTAPQVARRHAHLPTQRLNADTGFELTHARRLSLFKTHSALHVIVDNTETLSIACDNKPGTD